ncbi:ribonuclease D [Temperatibacter marinus]|uniref:Ribonuclease D n=1 Tax=Temperatibacter marinus TaxID=1456591 RepID=A0AA52H963_9PROT|nr:ribonuclease D [Temperatibacter marinus]WND02182.1 ribonuclease D [Temperatibacter marinus]
MKYITHSSDVELVCKRLSDSDFVTVDTEFLRDNTYYPKLCLIQVADDQDAHAIDPLADGIDLSAFWELMRNEKVIKVMHACRQDMEIFFNEMQSLPKPIFDTQVAASVCGFGDSVGYETLVNKIAKKSIDKSSRYTDWSRRPLTDKQLDYAIGDVTHLRKVYRFLDKRITERERSDWMQDELGILTSVETYDIDPTKVWQRVKVRTNNPRFLGILIKIAEWRERQAIDRNIPRNRVCKDDVLLEICAHPPKVAEDLDKIRGLSKGFSRSKAGQTLKTYIDAALEVSDEDLPKLDRNKPRKQPPPMVDLLKVLLKIRCNEVGVAPRLVASAAEIETLATNPEADIRPVQGWRMDVFGKDALAMINGKMALTARDGQITVVEVD